MNITEETALRLSRQIDLLLGGLGLSDNRRLAPIEAEEKAKAIVLKFRQKQQQRGVVYDSKAS